MFEPTIYERIKKKIEKITNPYIGKIRHLLLRDLDFSIISNNCWGGVVYEYLALQKKSPTIGCYFFADDYMRFISNLRYYLSQEIEIIDATKSKHSKALQEKYEMDIPVGKIDDVEVMFLHYKNKNIAKDKWERRRKRVNFDNIIVKFSDMNECTEEMLRKFDEQEFENIKNVKKIMFIKKPNNDYKNAIYYKGFEEAQTIENDTWYFKKYFRFYKFLNGFGLVQKN